MTTTWLRVFGLAASFGLWAAAGEAQTTIQQSTSASSSPNLPTPDSSTRPATTTFFGDTGLWYVPTAEVLARGTWAASGYRRGTNYIQGYTNVADFAGTAAVGLADRVELFGSFLVDTRVDRDARPIFTTDSKFGGVIDRNPLVNQGWTGDNVGDVYLGAKFNLWSETRQNPVAVAVRGMVKLPTGKKSAGVSTGKADGLFDVILSKEVGSVADVAGYAGYEVRGKPDGFDTPNGAFRWGTGASFPSRSPVRVFAELNGSVPSATTASLTTATLRGDDGSVPPIVSSTENLTRATMGLTFQARNGFFIGGGLSWNVPQQKRDLTRAQDDPFADYWDWQVRIGFHPGAGSARSSAAPAPSSSSGGSGTSGVNGGSVGVPQNRPPTVRARCEPCTVEVGRTSAVTADAQDPDGDALTYRWTAPTGTFQNPADRQTVWTAPQQEGPVPATVAVSDGKGGTASDTVTITVIRGAPLVELRFEDVYFDFDRYSLRPEAIRLLDDAVTQLQANPGRNIVIEGHTCNIGTAEYNLALGDRRASSVRQYLVSRGVNPGRLETRSYGEERPKYDNAREETRRLNRRAALVVKVQ